MMDFLQPLKIASLMFQDDDVFLPVLSRKLQGISDEILSLKGGQGFYMTSFCHQYSAAELSWNGIELNNNAGLGPATRQKLRQIRIDAMLLQQAQQGAQQENADANIPAEVDDNAVISEAIIFSSFDSFIDAALGFFL